MRISNSSIQTFKRCRRLWELQYKYGLQTIQIAPALETGLSYHDKLESLVKTGSFEPDMDAVTNAMATAFKKYILPQLTEKIKPEVWFKYQTRGGNTIVGRYDGLSKDSIVEHKSTSGRIDGSYWMTVELDEQILTYMMASKKDKVLYTVCQKPKLRQSKNETFEQYQDRCTRWFDVDTESKISVNEISHTLQEVIEHENRVDQMCEEIENCTNFYRNTAYCQHWGRMCEYAPICQHYDPSKNYIGFQRRGDRGQNHTASD